MTGVRGFTLVELMIVVVIIGILATIALPRLHHTKDNARLATMQSDLRNLVTAEEDFFVSHHTYAAGVAAYPTATDATLSPSAGNTVVLSSVTQSGWAAQMTNPALGGTVRTCGIYFGTATPPDPSVTTPGTPHCY